MGIFQDFIDSRPSLQSEAERIALRELEALRDAGDPDAPANFVGRTGWAILKVLGLTDLDEPPHVDDPLGFVKQDIDYSRAPISPDTGRIISSQIAIDDGNRKDVEESLLIHLDLCFPKPEEDCPFEVVPESAILISAPVDDYNPASLDLDDGDPVDTWNSDIGTDFLTRKNKSGEPSVQAATFDETAFNGRGGVFVDQSLVAASNNVHFESNDSVIPFENRTGTFAIVWQPTVSMPASHDFLTLVGFANQWFVATDTLANRPFRVFINPAIHNLETPAVDLTLNVPQLFFFWRDDDRVEFRRNGVARTGATLGTNPAPVGPGLIRWFGWTNLSAGGTTGIIARILRWDKVLTLNEITNIEAELTGLYF